DDQRSANMKSLRLSLLIFGVLSLFCSTSGDTSGIKRMKMQFRVFEEYTQALYQRYPDIRIEGENFLPIPMYRHVASFLSMFKLLVIGVIIIGKDPFGLLGMQAPGFWEWGQGNKIYACMMVFFFSNMIENQLLSTGAFEITLNDVPVWSKLESGHLPSMQQLVQILDNEMKMNVHMNGRPHHHS
uniref:Selenoprotein T n=1 Tax=Oryzias melastigma TaxID=30732 RepID=A0A3B3CEE1_ORYME